MILHIASTVTLSGSIVENTTTRISGPRVLPCWSVGYKIRNHIKLGFKLNEKLLSK